MTEPKQPAGLETFFDAARQEAPAPPGDLLARIEAQALAEQPRPGAGRSPVRGLPGQLRLALGGWPGLAGLAAACAAGVWIGVSPPDSLWPLYGTQDAILGALGLDPLSGFDLAMMEG